MLYSVGKSMLQYMCDCHQFKKFRSCCRVWLLILLRVTVYPVATLKLLSPLLVCTWRWGRMNASSGRISSDLTLFFRIWKMKCKLPLSCRTQMFTTHPFSCCLFPLCQLQNIFVVFLCFSPGSRELDWWSGAAGNMGKGCSTWPKCAWSYSGRRGWKVGEHPFSLSSPFLFFFLSPSKKWTGCWMFTYHNVGQSTKKKKKRRRRMGEEGCVSTARQQKLIEQKKTLERRVHGSG